MAGASIKVDYTFSDKEVTKRLKALVNAGEDLEIAFTDIGERLLNSTHERFDDEVDPDGNPWAGLYVHYQKRKKKNKDKILVLDSFLRDTLAYNPDSQGLELGTNLIYGATHQFAFPTPVGMNRVVSS
ncbi:MAG: phage virion morphogenesis protein [Gammaproteobacteria bacterium]|nr:phage virion morphogenesis protein [Gammaproteobacteria bacterium]